MILPRWTAYLALAVILILAVSGVPRRKTDTESAGAARAAREEAGLQDARATLPTPKAPRTVVLGIDGLDPDILRDVMAKYPERMRSFARLAKAGDGVGALGTSTPPQSPVAWSNFITGRGPGGHGIFDFIHRDPASYFVAPSTVKLKHSGSVSVPFTDTKFPTGGGSETNRTGRAFWTILKDAGVRADLYRVPINYPVEPADGVVFPGMLTPALDSAYGMYTLFTSDPPATLETNAGRFIPVRPRAGRVLTNLPGPPNAFKKGDPPATTPLTVFIDEVNALAVLEVGGQTVVVAPGQWTDWLRVSFDMLPAGAMSLGGIVRFKLQSLAPEFKLYASPINFDPMDPADTISYPEGAAAKLAEDMGGAYYTKGMPEDVGALKDGVFTDAEFMGQVDLVHRENGVMLHHALDRWTSDPAGGLLFFYVGTVDLSMHMMWRHQDPEHPDFDAKVAAESSSWWTGREGSTWRDVVEDLYLEMDPVLGAILDRVDDETLVMVISDHGFAPYRRKFSLNTWLLREGYIVLKEGRTAELPEDDSKRVDVHLFDAVDWARTKAYGIGFNGLYLNRIGREAQGIVTDAEAPALLAELKSKLEGVRDSAPGRSWDGAQVVLAADIATAVYQGERVSDAPDIIVGYNSGYGNSDEATQGRIPAAVLSDNLGGTFNGSHLMHPSVVEGVLLTNRRVSAPRPKLEDITATILKRYGVAPEPGMVGHAIFD
ncbi:MAG: alkaline phosphatase family protein [Planctomycetota bacterium]